MLGADAGDSVQVRLLAKSETSAGPLRAVAVAPPVTMWPAASTLMAVVEGSGVSVGEPQVSAAGHAAAEGLRRVAQFEATASSGSSLTVPETVVSSESLPAGSSTRPAGPASEVFGILGSLMA